MRDALLRLKVVELSEAAASTVRDKYAIGVFAVLGGTDSCMVGFLPRHLVKMKGEYDDSLVQVSRTFSVDDPNSAIRAKWHKNVGFCHGVIVSGPQSFRIVKEELCDRETGGFDGDGIGKKR